MKKAIIICSYFLLLLSPTQAQNSDKPWNMGFHGGIVQYAGDRGQNFYAYPNQYKQAYYGFGGLSISRYLGRFVDLNFLFTRAELGNFEAENWWGTAYESQTRHFLTSFYTGNMAFRLNMTTPEKYIRPYILLGAGVIYHEKKYTVTNPILTYSLPTAGAGFTIRLGETLNLQIQETFMYTGIDNIDGAVNGPNDSYLFHSAGLTFNLGKVKDTDGDGVNDKKDKCPETPRAAQIDEMGCPLDKDKDGVADYMDECPDIAGTVAFKGCADKDNDGIVDKEDRCPDEAGKSEMKGCPDKDGDGIVDIDDKCADTEKKYKVDATGCPMDNDKDGIFNEDDGCPEAAGIAALKGCPDKDGDGVSDADDHCPYLKGTMANKGCPEISKEDAKKITKIASNIFFETGSAKLKAVSMTQLNTLAEILQKYNGANLSIEGHTDDVGNDEFNMDLSQKRTDAVKEYLMKRGILESRLKAIGYGETKPIADNKKASGRAKNRRVELITSY